MKCLMYIACALLLLSACRTVEKAVGEANGTGGKPAWFQGRFRVGTAGAEKLVAHWDGVFAKGTIDDKAFLEANKILDAALLESIGNAEACAILQHDRIVNDCMHALYKSHEALKEAENGSPVESTRHGRIFAAIIKANEERFGEWLPEFRKWDKVHGDWSGAEWAGLFEGRRELSRVPEFWIGRDAEAGANLVAESLEQWRAAENFPVRLDDVGTHFKENKRLWLLKAIDKPEVPEGVKVYMNIHAFPGRCKVYVNASETISFEDADPRSFSVPLDFSKGKQCMVAIELIEPHPAEGDAVQHAPWPIWLVSDKG